MKKQNNIEIEFTPTGDELWFIGKAIEKRKREKVFIGGLVIGFVVGAIVGGMIVSGVIINLIVK